MIKQQVIPSSYKLVSFDVKSLFANVPLDRTIDIIRKRIYENHEIATNTGRKKIKDLITICTKNVLLTLNNDIHQQRDGVAMRSPLEPVFAGIIMADLENPIVTKLNSHLRFWKRYVDDTSAIVKEGSINHVLQQLNSFHSNIHFNFEIESSGTIPFLDILIIRKTSCIEPTVYRKSTDRHSSQLVLICTQHRETRKVEKISISSGQYLPYRISFEEGIVIPRKNVYL